MPLTSKGSEVMQAMQKEYGAKKGESVFYAAANKGTITGVHEAAKRRFAENLRKRSQGKR